MAQSYRPSDLIGLSQSRNKKPPLPGVFCFYQLAHGDSSASRKALNRTNSAGKLTETSSASRFRISPTYFLNLYRGLYACHRLLLPLQPILPFNPHPGDKVGIVGDQQQGARIVGQHLSEQLARGRSQMVVRLIERQLGPISRICNL